MPIPHLEFSKTFDVYPVPQQQVPRPDASTVAAGPATYTAATGIFGFGNAMPRFFNQIYPGLDYGLVGKTVLKLEQPQPVPVSEMADCAPSKVLPGYAAGFHPKMGQTWDKCPDRLCRPASTDGAQRAFTLDKEGYQNFALTNPQVEVQYAPKGVGPLHAAPPMLLTPEERRAALVFDKKSIAGRKELRKTANSYCRLSNLMQHAYPTGVLGLEAPGDNKSVVYSTSTFANKAEAEHKKAVFDAARCQNIKMKRDSQLGYPLMENDVHSTEIDKCFQGKSRTPFNSFENSTNNYEMAPHGTSRGLAFRSNQEKVLTDCNNYHNSARRQNLVNLTQGAKGYDIITGTQNENYQPTVPERINQRRGHESNWVMHNRGGEKRAGTAPTFVGPACDAHTPQWAPPPSRWAAQQVKSLDGVFG